MSAINIIGISGHMGSGKDTVGLMIQYNSYFKHNNVSWENYWELQPDGYTGEWEIKKFAYKLKQIVSLLIDCDMRDLEDQLFKHKPLGDEWMVYKGTYRYWNSYIKKTFLDVPPEEIDMGGGHFGQLEVMEKIHITPRLMLQLVGTECFREIIHPNTWVNSLFADYKPKYLLDHAPETEEELETNLIYPKWIITDCRFPNEAQAIKDRGGLVICINRPQDAISSHKSETALDNWEFDYVINNENDIPDLLEKVNKFCIKFDIQ